MSILNTSLNKPKLLFLRFLDKLPKKISTLQVTGTRSVFDWILSRYNLDLQEHARI
jgi:hypothetical protein